jgi:hypothetical protein
MSNKRDPYPTDINDTAWELICPLFPVKKCTKPRKYELREMLNMKFLSLRR